MDESTVLRMLQGAVGALSASAAEQEQWIDSASDHPKAYTTEQAWLTCWVLTQLAREDELPSRREAALHAIAEIAEWHPTARAAVGTLASLDRTELSVSEQEYLDFLLPGGGMA